MEDHQPAVQVAVLKCMTAEPAYCTTEGGARAKVRGWASSNLVHKNSKLIMKKGYKQVNEKDF